ncbi:MAG: hypothetical protein ABI402_21110 [Ferruginibacter sp.]
METTNRGISISDKVKTIRSHFDYLTIWEFLQSKGIELYGKNFKLLEEDADLIIKLICWFIKDELQAKKLGIDLEKGILIVGPVGCGKTSLMNICRFLLSAEKRHSIKSCRDISFEFMKDGHDIFHRYTKGSFRQDQFEPKIFCFDDLGLESKMNFYGNECSVMGEILLSRYDLYHSFGMMTHITTNLNSDEIEQRYGHRVRSRCRELFNLIAFPADTPDKRK